MAAIVYATVGSNDLARAMAFYDELLATAYFRDLDGNKICAFAFTRVDSEALHDLTVAMGKS